MPDFSFAPLADQLEARIRANRLLDLPADWADELVFPYYNGLALNNVPQTIARLLGASNMSDNPLDDAVWGDDLPYGDVDRVVLFISDGLGYRWLKQLLTEDELLVETVSELTGGRGPVPITSIAPSTTAVALPTLWAGVPPLQHGMLGTRLFMRELSMLVNLLHYVPQGGRHLRGVIGEWGLELENLLPGQILGEVLIDEGIETHLLILKELARTGLSRVMHRGIGHFHIQNGYADMWWRVEDVLTQTAGQRCYINIYWPAIDSLSHNYGAHTRYVRREIQQQLDGLRTAISNPAVQDGRTLLMIVADHGHHDLPNTIQLAKDETARPIYEAIRGAFGGESRFPYLYVRGGKVQQVVTAIEQHHADCLTYVLPDDAIAAGLFGPPETVHPEAVHRLGDVLVIPRLTWGLADHMRKPGSVSRHGGLSDWEMLVPLMWSRF